MFGVKEGVISETRLLKIRLLKTNNIQKNSGGWLVSKKTKILNIA